jgi:hypothetical protein
VGEWMSYLVGVNEVFFMLAEDVGELAFDIVHVLVQLVLSLQVRILLILK